MKLRLLREDNTPATIADLCTFPIVDIDGVPCTLTEYEGPTAETDTSLSGDETGSICLRLDYEHNRRDQYIRRGPGKTDVVKRYECPFARKARMRAIGGES